MTKSELKLIIKECLIEILTTGLGESLNEVSKKKRETQTLLERKKQEELLMQKKRDLKSNISFATNDPVLKNILEHTAQTTLKDQAAHEYRVPMISDGLNENFGQASVDAGPGINIDKLFNEASRNWSAAAFGEKKRQS